MAPLSFVHAARRSSLFQRRIWNFGVLLAALTATGAVMAAPAAAQTPSGSSRTAGYSRTDLELAAQAAERDPKRRAEAEALRARLQNGDYSPGDRLVLELRGDSALFDTLTVRSGPSLRLPNIPDVPLRGVLRSEVQDYLTKYLARYIREPDVRAESLIRVSMLGQVGRPGFYDFNSDMLLTDAIMAAGGPTSTAAIDRSTITRGKTVVLAKERVSRAAQTGATLDRLGLRPGDEVTVGEKRKRWDAQTILGIAGAVASLGITILYFVRN